MRTFWNVFLLLLLSPSFTYSQPELLAAFSNDLGDLLGYQAYEDHGIFIWQRQPQVWRVDFATQEAEVIDDFPQIKQVKRVGRRLFAFARRANPPSQLLALNLLVYDSTGLAFEKLALQEAPANEFYYSWQAVVLGEQVFLHTKGPDYTSQLWKSDGTEAGTQVLANFEQQLLQLQPFQGSLIVLQSAFQGTSVWRYHPQQGFDSLGLTPFRGHPLGAIGETADHLYFSGADSSFAEAVWRTGLTPGSVETFLRIPGGRKIDFFDGRFRLNRGNPFSGLPVVGRLDQPQAYQVVAVRDSVTRQFRPSVWPLAHPAHYLVGLPHTGLEVARIDAQDSLSLVADFIPGAGGAYPYFGMWGGYIVSTQDAQGRLLLPLSRDADGYHYLYRLEEEGFKPLARIEAGAEPQSFFRQGETLFWIAYEFQAKEYHIYRFDLAQAQPLLDLPARPAQTWYRELGASNSNFTGQNVNNTVQLNDLEVSATGEVLAGYLTRRYLSEATPSLSLVSHSSVTDTLQALRHVAKFDPDGRLLWRVDFGDSEYYPDNLPRIAMDPAGDVWVFGGFFRRALFGPDSLITLSKGNFLAKIDGQTGTFNWFKSLFPNVHREFLPAGEMLTDPAGNLYLPIELPFPLEIEGQRLESDWYPAKALLSYDPAGELRWARVLTVPWKEPYIAKLTLVLDEARDRLIAIQDRRSPRRTGDCDNTPFRIFQQTLDLNGTLLDSLRLGHTSPGGLAGAVLDTDGELVTWGYYQGTLPLQYFSFSPAYDSATADTSYRTMAFRQAGSLGDLAQAWVADPANFQPLAVEQDGGYFYLLGATSSGRYHSLSLFKFDPELRLIGYQPLNQFVDLCEASQGPAFVVKNGYLHIAGSNFQYHPQSGILPSMQQTNRLSVLKMADAGWLAPEAAFAEVQTLGAAAAPEARAFPNPFSGSELSLLLGETGRGRLQKATLLDLQGRELAAFSLADAPVQQLSLPPNLSPGYYLLRLTGSGEPLVSKLLKL